jgi:hypothetical protein
MICTLYSSKTGYETIVDLVKTQIPNGKISVTRENEFHFIEVVSKKGFFGSKEVLKFVYRERLEPEVPVSQAEDCPLSENINGLYRFVSSLPANNDRLKRIFYIKIRETQSEFSVIQEKGTTKNLRNIIRLLAQKFDAYIFAQTGTLISKSDQQHFLTADLKLLLDVYGNSEVDSLGDAMEAKYEAQLKKYRDEVLADLSDDQKARKFANEDWLVAHKIRINPYLPAIGSEAETDIKTAKEIAERLAAMVFINGFASNYLSSEQATDLMKKGDVLQFITPNEQELLDEEDSEAMQQESWKTEGIYTLLWALNVIDELEHPSEMCDLGGIAQENYPLVDPQGFIKKMTNLRSKKEILDAADLYYRMHWACVDARIKRMDTRGLNPAVVYERLYALNWLISAYGESDWDEVQVHS